MKEKVNQSGSAQKGQAMQNTKAAFQKAGHVFSVIGKVLYHMRKLFLAVPVVWLAVRLYGIAMEKLPPAVGLMLQESGEYARMVDRETAALGCMAVTAVCLLMMFLSRRTLYPWLISLFSLVLPLLLIVTNIFPA